MTTLQIEFLSKRNGSDAEQKQLEPLSEIKSFNDAEQKQLEVNRMDIPKINIDKITDEIIENNVLSRMNPPRTPESDGEDVKEDIHYKFFDSAKEQYPEFDAMLNNLKKIPPLFGDHYKNSTKLAEKLIKKVENGYDELIKHVTERRDVLLKEISNIQQQNKEETDEMMKDFEKLQNKMESYQTEIYNLSKLQSSTQRDNDIQQIISEATRYNQNNHHSYIRNIFKLLNKSKLLTLSLFIDANQFKDTILRQFKLLSDTKPKASPKYETYYPPQNYERGQFPRYVENNTDRSYYNNNNRTYRSRRDSYYDSYGNTHDQNRDDSWNSNEWRSYDSSSYHQNNRARRGRRRGGRTRPRWRDRRQYEHSYNDQNYNDYNYNDGDRNRNRDRERSDSYAINDYIPTVTPTPTPTHKWAGIPSPPRRHRRDIDEELEMQSKNTEIADNDIINNEDDDDFDDNDNNGSVGKTTPKIKQRKKQWTVKHNNDENKNMDGDEDEDEDDEAFPSNTHHIFVRDTQDLDFSTIKQKYRDIVVICQFSAKYHSKNGLELCKNRTVLQRRENQKHGYAVLDCKPVFEGAHCWRIKCKNFSPWIFIGVCRPFIQYTDTSWNNKYIWGISTCSQSNRNGHWALDYSVKTPWKNKTVVEIDMLLDCNDGTLKYQQIQGQGQGDPNQDADIINLDGLDRNDNNSDTKNGQISWVPHFNLHTPGSYVSVKKIPHTRFGQIW